MKSPLLAVVLLAAICGQAKEVFAEEEKGWLKRNFPAFSFEVNFADIGINKNNDGRVFAEIREIPLSIRTIHFHNMEGNPLNNSRVIVEPPENLPIRQEVVDFTPTFSVLNLKLWLFSTVGFGISPSGPTTADSRRLDFVSFGEKGGNFKTWGGYNWNGYYEFQIRNESREKPNLIVEIKTPAIKIPITKQDFLAVSAFAGYKTRNRETALYAVQECYWWGAYQTKYLLGAAKFNRMDYAGMNFLLGNSDREDFLYGFRALAGRNSAEYSITELGKACELNFGPKPSLIWHLGFTIVFPIFKK